MLLAGGATPSSGQGGTSQGAGKDGEGAGWPQQSQPWGDAPGAWRRCWQPFPRSQLDEQVLGGGEHAQLSGASQNTLQVVLLP